jgi:hypothetical protein
MRFSVSAVSIAVVFCTPGIVQTLATGIANALGVHWVTRAEESGPVDLPTYTNIWRIEKRLYKLYDFRLPMPLPINWIAVFAGIAIPYIILLIAIGLPFNHTLVLLYVLSPGVLTWLTTWPALESKRLPKLVESQARYLTEPRTWVRLAPLSEKDQMMLTARVWRSRPPRRPARPARATRRRRTGTGPGCLSSIRGGSSSSAASPAPGSPSPRTW